MISKDTVVCVSLAGRPSNIGTRFHNYLYEELGLDFLYKSFTTTDLAAAIGGIRALGIRGCGVSMPFKEECIPLVDELAESAAVIRSVNTIVNDDGQLVAYNTDVIAVASLLSSHHVPVETGVAVLGSGGMAKAVVAALASAGCREGIVVARNESSGRALADAYGFAWQPALGAVRPHVVVNATPIGMAGGPDADRLPVADDVVEAAGVVFDVVAMPARTPLVVAAERAGATVITGAEVIALQAAEQFALYTGVRPTPEQVARASAYSRS